MLIDLDWAFDFEYYWFDCWYGGVGDDDWSGAVESGVDCS